MKETLQSKRIEKRKKEDGYNLIKELETEYRTNKSKYWRKTKRLKGYKTEKTEIITDKNHKTMPDTEDILFIW